MGTTPSHSWPYPSVDDEPNGAAEIQALAEAVEATVNAIESDVTDLAAFAADTSAAMDGSTWVPTLTNIVKGSGTVVARFKEVGQMVDFFFLFTLGAGSSIGNGPRFTLPFTPHASIEATVVPIGYGTAADAVADNYAIVGRLSTVSNPAVLLVGLGTGGQHTVINASAPFAFGVGDSLSLVGRFEKA